MISFAVCDDDFIFGNELWKKIHMLCAKKVSEDIECTVIPTFSSAKSVLEYLNSASIDVLFLDIDMPEMSGFQLASKLCKEHPDMLILFVSFFDDFVYASFDYSPFRFLRKSHIDDELENAFDKVMLKLLEDKNALTFNTVDGEQTVLLKDVLFIESAKNYYLVNLSSGEQMRCRGTLSQLEEQIKNFDFSRIQSSYIVNLNHIECVKNNTAFMDNGYDIPISRRKIDAFQKQYLKFTRRRYETI